ncbi:hypothetical protein [Azospirillum agricola]|uniref:hypothetical protein n=1 Tax=Azospirillum agricola TaxID=1720247 RepID=UPI000A0F2B79|nr:hypothetical protein [Azospirillum agricola]SMH41611.1 hypothetical protein SAMN02982994_1748 [Azospirillum lipoferum]
MLTLRHTSDLPKNTPLFIFGSGAAGQHVRKALGKVPGLTVLGFIDSYKSGTLDGLPVHRFDEFIDSRPAQSVVVIASMYVNEMAEQLAGKGMVNVYNGYPYAMSLIDQAVLIKNLMVVGTVAAVIAVLAGWFLF